MRFHKPDDTQRITSCQRYSYRTRIAAGVTFRAMKDATARRLKQARERAGFKSGADFCRAHELPESTYRSHENGTRGISLPQARLYARLLNVPLNWLLEGKEGDDIEADYLAKPAVKLTAEIMFEAIRDGRYKSVSPVILADMLTELARHFHPSDFPDKETAQIAAKSSLRFALERWKR